METKEGLGKAHQCDGSIEGAAIAIANVTSVAGDE